MRLEDPNAVDYLGTEKGSGALVLTLLDDYEGGDILQRLELLQRKLNRYFEFIESGEIFEHREQAIGKRVPRDTPIRIDVVAKSELLGEGEKFLQHVARAAKDVGVGFSFRVVRP